MGVALVVVGFFFDLGYFSAVGVVLFFVYAGGAGYSFFSCEEGAFVGEHGCARSHQEAPSSELRSSLNNKFPCKSVISNQDPFLVITSITE